MKNLSGLLAVLAVLLCTSISYGQTNYVKRINCGDSNATTHNGETYDADNQTGYTYTGNTTATSGHSGFTLDTNPGEIFALTRYTGGTTSMQYDFPVLDGDYDIILHWAEPYHGPAPLSGSPADHRQFDVQINGILVEDNLNVYGEAGLNNSLVRTYRVTATGNSGVTIDFIDQGENDPIINAIEVLGVTPAPIPVTDVALSSTTLDLEIGDNPVQLTATVTPNNASDLTINWTSSNSSVATVNAGLVSVVGVGTSVITATANDGSNQMDTSTITVTDPNSQPVPAGGLWLSTNNTDAFILNSVGIGTNPISNYKLAVDGKIRSREVKVDNDNWADYVFFKDYKLPTLQEVEQHIQEKGHLINIPSAAEVEANGIELGEMNKLLLEKIEELTLYVIEQEKRIQSLEDNK